MKNSESFLGKNFKSIALTSISVILSAWNMACIPSYAQLSGISEIPREREIYNTLPGNDEKGTILDVTNPMDLMNRLRRATAMQNATSPSDAIDEALKALESDTQ